MIKRCPFCGCEANLKICDNGIQFTDDIQKFYVICTECGATGKPIYLRNAQYRDTYMEEFHKAKKEAIDAWNTRKGEN